MGEDFEKVFEEIKEQDLNPENTRKYLLKVKRFIEQIKQESEEELSTEQIKEIFEKEYGENLRTDCKASDIYVLLRKYATCRKILELIKGNKNEFNRRLKIAKRLEKVSPKDNLILEDNEEKDTIAALRGVLRNKTRVRNAKKSEIELIKEQENEIFNIAQQKMIDLIQESISYLEKFGVIDDSIEEVNEILEKLNLNEFKYVKRNPITEDDVPIIADGRILPKKDENGNEISYTKDDSKVKEEDEDIGVIDSFSRSNLEKLSLDDLLLLNTFWKSKEANFTYELSKAEITINYLDIWDEIINSDEDFINNIDSEKIKLGLKKDLILTYLCRKDAELTDSLVEKYIKYLEIPKEKEEQDNDKKTSLVNKLFKGKKIKKEQIKQKREEINLETDFIKDKMKKFSNGLADVMLLECSIIEKLESKGFKGKIKWGILESPEVDSANEIAIVIENPNFRGPLIMSIPKSSLREFLGKDKIEFPIYKNELNEEYTEVMSKIYMSKSKNFIKEAAKKYKQDPTSALYAGLAGKKVKNVSKNIEEPDII